MKNTVMWAIRDARGLSMSEKACLWALASRGSGVWASQETVAQDMGANVKTLRGASRRLEDKGLLLIESRFGKTNLYSVDEDAVLALPKVVEPDDMQTSTKTGTPTESGTSTKTGRTPLPKLVEGSTKSGRTPLPKVVDKEEKKKNLKKNLKKNSDSTVADAPVATNSDTQGLEEGSDSSSVEPPISEPLMDKPSEPSITGTVDDSTSTESSISEGTITEAGVRAVPAQTGTPDEPARKYPVMNQPQLEAAVMTLKVSSIDVKVRNICAFPANRKAIAERASHEEFRTLKTAGERVSAALTAIMAERKTA